MKKIILIKIGGGLVTDKKIPDKPKLQVIENITKEIKAVIENNPNINFIIGHGTGSFGHFPVKEYQLENSTKTNLQKIGLSKVESSVLKLNILINDYFLKQRLTTFPIHPSSIIISENNFVKEIFINPLIKLMKLNMIPLVHGDMVFDNSNGSLIISTEQLFLLLVRKLIKQNYLIDKIIYLSNIDGVLDRKGKIITKITKNNYSKLNINFDQSDGVDVTGKMENKIKIGLKMTKYNIKSLIINGNINNNLINALSGKDYIGTLIE